LLLSKENPVIDQQATKLSVYLQAVLSQQHWRGNVADPDSEVHYCLRLLRGLEEFEEKPPGNPLVAKLLVASVWPEEARHRQCSDLHIDNNY
jgi:hypothetical protein